MSFLKKLFSGGNPSMPKVSNVADPNALWLYVRCARCGAPVSIRVDTRNDISIDYETGGRFLRKEMMDSSCFQLMYANVRFDGGGKIIEQSVERGEFLTPEEYENARIEFENKKQARANS